MGPMAPDCIPWAAVQQWAAVHAMDRHEAAFLDRCIVAMDLVFLARWSINAAQASRQSALDQKLKRWDETE